jgi:hypothetical protein
LNFARDLTAQSYTSVSEAGFRELIAKVDRHCTRIRITQGRRNRGFSIAFDTNAKRKIAPLLSQIKEIVDAAEIDDRKRESLYARIAALQAEVDKARTRFETFAAYFIETAGIVGEVAIRLEPLTNAVAKIFGVAKSREDATPALPKPPEPRKLPAPDPDIDDEIPF